MDRCSLFLPCDQVNSSETPSQKATFLPSKQALYQENKSAYAPLNKTNIWYMVNIFVRRAQNSQQSHKEMAI